MRMTGKRTDAMTIESVRSIGLDVRHADPYGSRLRRRQSVRLEDQKAKLGGASIVDGRLEGRNDRRDCRHGLLAYWRAGHGAKGA